MKTDAAMARTAWLTGITPYVATLGGVVVIVALACGFALAFSLLVQDIAGDASAYDASSSLGSDYRHTVQTRAEFERWRDGHTNLALPQVVDRWFDEPTAVD